MRYVTLRLVPEQRAFGAVEEAIVREDEIERSAIHYVNVLEDGTVVMLEEFQGRVERLEQIYAAHPDVHTYSATCSAGCIYVHVHFQANETVTGLLRLPQEHEVVLDTPMEYTDDGALLVRFLGEQSEFRRMLEKIPDPVGVSIERIGEYRPVEERLFDRLTAEQQRTLELAVERGYFEVPRRTTCDELGDELGISASAVSNQLRRVEAEILSAVVSDA